MNSTVIPIATRPAAHAATAATTFSAEALDEVRRLIGDEPRRRDLLIEHLHKIQDRHAHLSAEHLAALAHEMRLPLEQVLEVASYYQHFDVVREGATPPPALTVRVCDGLACEMAGATDLLQRLPALLGREVRVQAVPCLGRCAQAPATAVGQNPVAPASAERVVEAVRTGHTQHPQKQFLEGMDYEAYRAHGGYQLLQACLSGALQPEGVIHTLEEAGLRGLGGAGFPVARKWRTVRAAAGPRMMVVNIGESEPGAFKDRALLERDAHRFLEGMLIAAWAVGAQAIYIHLRDDYHGCREMLAFEIDSLRQELPVAELPEIHLRRGAGAYVCGEESALIEALEGKRGLPRLHPPHVAQIGLFGHATLEHNFETLYWLREVLEKGSDWYRAQGRNGRQGLRAYSVSGRVQQAGVKLAPAGITVQQLIDEYCGGMQPGHRLYAYLPGGASGGILPASLNQLPLDFDTLQPYGCSIGSAAIVVLSQHDSVLAASRRLMRFLRDESCGQCPACSNGTARALALMSQADWDALELAEVSATLQEGSRCGLGRSAPHVFNSVLRHFPQELA
jgi:formate dehydrogenase beta subunit